MKLSNPLVILGIVLVVGIAAIAVKEAQRNTTKAETVAIEDEAGSKTQVVILRGEDPAQLSKGLSEIDARQRRWNDVFQLALVTSRMSLSPLVKDMQDQLRENELLEFPACMRNAKPYWIESQRETVSSFLAFLVDAEHDVAPALGKSSRAQRNFQTIKEACQAHRRP